MRAALVLVLLGCSSPSTTPPLSSGPRPREDVRDATTRAVLDIYPHVFVIKAAAFPEYREVMKSALELGGDEIVDAQAIAIVMLETVTPTGVGELVIEGLPAVKTRVRRDVEKYLTDGVLPGVASGREVPIAIGDGVAKRLGVRLGDTFPARRTKDTNGRDLPDGPDPAHTVRVVGILHTGAAEVDARTAFTTFEIAQDLEGRGDVALAIAVKLAHVNLAPAIARRLEDKLGGMPYQVQDWCALNKDLLHC